MAIRKKTEKSAAKSKGLKKPVAKAKKPVTKAKKPLTKAKKPVTKVKKPVAKAKKPVTKAKKPVAKAKKSVAKAKKAGAIKALVQKPTELELSLAESPEAEPAADENPLVEVKEVFDHYDRNDNGFIESGELSRLLEALGAPPSPLELSAAVSALDSNASGKVSWDEFKEWWLRRV